MHVLFCSSSNNTTGRETGCWWIYFVLLIGLDIQTSKGLEEIKHCAFGTFVRIFLSCIKTADRSKRFYLPVCWIMHEGWCWKHLTIQSWRIISQITSSSYLLKFVVCQYTSRSYTQLTRIFVYWRCIRSEYWPLRLSCWGESSKWLEAV